MSLYKTLFEVSFFHKYYDGYKSSDFEISLLPATRELLIGYSLLYRFTATGFLVLFDDDRKYLLESVREKLTLSFGIRSLNPHFETFTNIHPINKSLRYFFDNENLASVDNDSLVSNDTNQICLHALSFVDTTNLFRYAYPHSNVRKVLGAEEIVVERDGQVCFSGELAGTEKFVTLGLTLGCYNISIKGQENKIKFYLLPDAFEKSFAVMDISFGGSSSNSFKQLTGAQYRINFENRSILWTYYFVSDSGRQFEQVDVYSGKEKLSFSNPVKVMLANGQIATKITSLISFPLQQRFSGKQVHAELLEKSEDMGSGEPKLKINLSTPNATRIKGRRVGDDEVYFSEIFVYV